MVEGLRECRAGEETEPGQDLLQHGHHGVVSILCACRTQESGSLSRVEYRCIRRWVAEEVGEEAFGLEDGKIASVKGRVVQQGIASTVKLETDDGGSLLDEVATVGGRDEGRGEDEAFQGPQVEPVDEAHQIKVSERLRLCFIHGLPEAFCELRVSGQALNFVHEQTVCEEGGVIPCCRRVGGENTSLCCDDEAPQKVQIGFQAVLFGELRGSQHACCGEGPVGAAGTRQTHGAYLVLVAFKVVVCAEQSALSTICEARVGVGCVAAYR